ncbi:MAG: insulinase family protein [Clostridiales bacterium]|jgi:predicted Zn-dependent peptidase|nr:insulinase family protein [Clostridiales bacterium]
MESVKTNEFLGENLHTKQLSSGIKCYIIPKCGYAQMQAAVAVNFGSADYAFKLGNEVRKFPAGIAHFMEHKLFEGKKESVFEQFTKNGADVNAFTNFTNTAYYFSCTDNFANNLRLLLHFVQNPYFTEANVNKEKGIIIQEINMYKDDPLWACYQNLLSAMYFNSPVTSDIAGSEQSVNSITADMLEDCYSLFYNPPQMAVICAGGFDINEVYDIIEKYVSPKVDIPEITRCYGEEKEPRHVRQREVTAKTQIAAPLFNIGFKDIADWQNPIKNLAAGKLLIDLIAGEGSNLYEKLYAQNLADASFYVQYTAGTFFAYTMLSGFSENPHKVNELLLNEIRKYAQNGISSGDFIRLKQKHTGRLRMVFNSIHAITQAQIDFFSKKADLFDLLTEYENLTLNDVNEKLAAHLVEGANALSIVKGTQ